MTSLDYIAIAAVLIIGVPHGGLDGALARRVGWAPNLAGWLTFHIAYVAIAALVTIIWWWFPATSLGVFLLISAVHFGVSDIRHIMQLGKNHWLPVLAHGGLVAIAIPAFHTEEVVAIFAILVGDSGTQSLISIIEAALKPYLMIVTTYFLYSIRADEWRITAANLVVLLLIAYWAAPLVSFAVYFCLWHSRSHTLRIWHSIDAIHRRRCLLEAAAYSILAWLTAAVCFWYFKMTPDAALIQLTFIGLAALTVPHMLLVDFADSKLHRLMA